MNRTKKRRKRRRRTTQPTTMHQRRRKQQHLRWMSLARLRWMSDPRHPARRMRNRPRLKMMNLELASIALRGGGERVATIALAAGCAWLVAVAGCVSVARLPQCSVSDSLCAVPLLMLRCRSSIAASDAATDPAVGEQREQWGRGRRDKRWTGWSRQGTHKKRVADARQQENNSETAIERGKAG